MCTINGAAGVCVCVECVDTKQTLYLHNLYGIHSHYTFMYLVVAFFTLLLGERKKALKVKQEEIKSHTLIEKRYRFAFTHARMHTLTLTQKSIYFIHVVYMCNVYPM